MVSFDCFPLFLHFLPSLVKLIFWLKFFQSQKADRRHEEQGPQDPAPFQPGYNMKWSEVKVAQLCTTLCDPMDYTVYGIFQARMLEWVAFLFFRGSSQHRDWTQVSHIAGEFFTSWATREALGYNGFIQLSVFLSRNNYHLEIKWLLSFLQIFTFCYVCMHEPLTSRCSSWF